ncbi:DASH complex subunit Duo1-domain-containing protein [Gigaspora rosea]|uniref:DASH complex subunit DUO1 n=1 Tax=Gigaspora rosea TaxID=44941 RepID=A0A397US96_9GLOM|nr:DASH complex subunit Duo1-domain-containing protein [Gigaspora rosea]
MADSPLSPDFPTFQDLQDQEFPECSAGNSFVNQLDETLSFKTVNSINSILKNDSSIWLTNQENSLRKEYRTLTKINEMFEKVNDNMDQAALNLQQFSNTVEQTDQLLDIWINILSQSIHTQQLFSDPSWQGSSAKEKQHKNPVNNEKID